MLNKIARQKNRMKKRCPGGRAIIFLKTIRCLQTFLSLTIYLPSTLLILSGLHNPFLPPLLSVEDLMTLMSIRAVLLHLTPRSGQGLDHVACLWLCLAVASKPAERKCEGKNHGRSNS